MNEHRWDFYGNEEREWAICRDCGEKRYKDIGERLNNESLLGDCPCAKPAKTPQYKIRNVEHVIIEMEGEK